MNKKRTSLEAILNAEPVTSEPRSGRRGEVEAVEPTKPKRAIKQQTVYLPVEIYEQLRRLAFEEHVKMHSLLMEGLDRVFLDRGLPSLNDIKREDAT